MIHSEMLKKKQVGEVLKRELAQVNPSYHGKTDQWHRKCYIVSYFFPLWASSSSRDTLSSSACLPPNQCPVLAATTFLVKAFGSEMRSSESVQLYSKTAQFSLQFANRTPGCLLMFVSCSVVALLISSPTSQLSRCSGIDTGFKFPCSTRNKGIHILLFHYEQEVRYLWAVSVNFY